MADTTIPAARIARLGWPCCGLHHDDKVRDPDGRIDKVDTVGPIHVNVIDGQHIHHVYLPDQLQVVAA